ncbi:hypothetical protein ACLF9G_06590 [Helicobacter pylori]
MYLLFLHASHFWIFIAASINVFNVFMYKICVLEISNPTTCHWAILMINL